jgi:peptidoglycan/LPS O-acetylase OafA/YrhL
VRAILSEHDERLQSLRGLAALSVMVGHASLLLPQTPFSLVQGTLFEQNSAVVFFYVLSGFVLGESLRRGQGARSFIVRRLARLLPVFWSSIALGVVAASLMRHAPIEGASGWFNDNFLSIFTRPRDIVLNVLGLSTTINGALWSIQVELAMAPLLLLLVPLTDRISPLHNLIAIGLILVLADRALLPFGIAHESARPFVYVHCFYLGIAIPRLLGMSPVKRFLQSGRAVLAGLGLAALCHVLMMKNHFSIPAKFTVDAIVSAQIVAYVIATPRVASFLRAPLLVGLGDISYSFYAYGQIVLAAVAFGLFRISPTPWWESRPALFILSALSIALAIAIPMAWASYRRIELPGIAFGRALTQSSAARWTAESARTQS